MSFDKRINTQLGLLPEDWNIKTLGDELYIKGRIGWKGLKKNEYLEKSAYRIINGSNIINNKIDWSNCGYISEERYDESPEIMLESNDIVMTKDGTIGKVAKLDTINEKTTVASGLFVIRNKSEIIDTDYLFYYFNSHYFKSLVQGRIEGSVIPHLYQRDFVSMQIPLPTQLEQKAIANILSSLDEKIEVNNAINKKLEDMAQVIFKQWFVDFEFPNEEGKPYKSSGGAMVESELGMIPKGWKVSKIGELCEANQASKSNKEKWEFVNYLDTSNITKNCIDNIQRLDTNVDKIPSRAKRKVKKNDIVYSTVRPNQYHHGIIKAPVENMLASTGFIVLTSKSSYSNDLIYLWLNQEETTTKLQSIAEQSTSTYPSIKPSDILSMKILVPFDKQLNYLSKIIGTQNNQISINQQQNQKLSQIRDTLLPKLMSGEIRIPVEKE